MIRIEFTAQEIEALDYERYHHPHPKVQRKMEALWLKSQGSSHHEIARLTGISANTLRAHLRQYQADGIDGLNQLHYHPPQSELASHRQTIEDYFKEHPPATIKQAAEEIYQLTGIRRSETRVRAFLKSIGIKRMKVGHIPAKADGKKQQAFKEEKLQPRLDQAAAGQRAVFFVDAAHFVLAPFLGFLWSFTRIFIKAPAGRKRFNVLGALNAITHELIMVQNDSYINALSVCDLLRCIAALGVTVPITLVLDNAKYQKCQIVYQLAQTLDIELLYLPAYSPNLNLIERLWKFVKKKCLYSKYYAEFADFKAAISDCLNQTNTTYKTELDTLLALRFQTFENAQLLAA